MHNPSSFQKLAVIMVTRVAVKEIRWEPGIQKRMFKLTNPSGGSLRKATNLRHSKSNPNGNNPYSEISNDQASLQINQKVSQKIKILEIMDLF